MEQESKIMRNLELLLDHEYYFELITVAKKHIKINPKSENLNFILGVAYARNGEPKRAHRQFKLVVNLSKGKNHAAFNNLITSSFEIGDTKLALLLAELAISQNKFNKVDFEILTKNLLHAIKKDIIQYNDLPDAIKDFF